MTGKETKIAVVILAMVAASAAMLVRGMRLDEGAARIGPIRSLSSGVQERLAVFHDKHLHLLDDTGRRLARQPLRELLLTEKPNDMDWTVNADGKAQAWFFEDTTPRLVRCDLAPETSRLERCAQVAAGPQLKVNAMSRAVHIAVDIARERVYVADAKGHAVRALTLDGRVLGQSTPGDLFFPNRLRMAGDFLMVADNDHRRLVWLDIQRDKPGFALRRSLQASAHPQARDSRTKVTDFAFLPGPDGQPSVLWMLAVAQGQKDGDLLVWGPGLKPQARASLGGFSDPLAVDRLGEAAVIADFDGVALYRVGAGGAYLGSFGDEAFQGELRASRQQIAAASTWNKAAWASFAATLVIGFLLAWRYGEKPGQQAARAAFGPLAQVQAEVPRDTVVLAPGDWYSRQMAWIGAAGIAATLAMLLVLWFVFPHEVPPGVRQDPRLWGLLGVLVLLFALLPLTIWWGVRVSARELVLTNGRVQICRGERIVASAPVREVMASPQALLVGRTLLQYRARTALDRPGRWIYDQDRLTRYLLAHLPPERRVAHPELARAVLKRMLLWQQLVLGLPLLAWLAFEVWRIFNR